VLRVGHFGAGWGSECAAGGFVVGGFGHHVVVSRGNKINDVLRIKHLLHPGFCN